MAKLNNVLSGMKGFLDSELLSKMNGINKWIVGASLSMAIDNGAETFNRLKKNEFIKMLGIINEETDEIDIPKIYKYLSEQSQKGSVTFSLPLVGAITLQQTDVDKLYQRIMGNI